MRSSVYMAFISPEIFFCSTIVCSTYTRSRLLLSKKIQFLGWDKGHIYGTSHLSYFSSMVISDMNPPFSTSFLTTWMMKIHNPWRALIISVNEYHVQQPLEANMVLVYYDQIRTQWVLSWVFWNFFKQIQNQQKAGIRDCILSPCHKVFLNKK